jgi:hypothetical protein
MSKKVTPKKVTDTMCQKVTDTMCGKNLTTESHEKVSDTTGKGVYVKR